MKKAILIIAVITLTSCGGLKLGHYSNAWCESSEKEIIQVEVNCENCDEIN
tara:strand:+ start:449 stop:601 length:153 start_codon:yes stop_codon:yes gene_type:complete